MTEAHSIGSRDASDPPARLNKILISAQLLQEAVQTYRRANASWEYAACILLAGAAHVVFSDLLDAAAIADQPGEKGRQGVTSSVSGLQLLAKSPALLRDADLPVDEKIRGFELERSVYNSLKHAGDRSKKIPAWADISTDGDMPYEACNLAGIAMADFRTLLSLDRQELDHELRKQLELISAELPARIELKGRSPLK